MATTEGIITIREARPEDFAALVEIVNLSYPDYPTSIEEFEHRDKSFDYERYFRMLPRMLG